LFLLPPSEGKNHGGRAKSAPDRFKTQLGDARKEVILALSALLDSSAPAVVEKRLKVRNDLLNRALLATRAVIEGTAKQLPAWQRYSGVVWAHLEPQTLAREIRRRILVPSALYGLTSADDMIADYRLTMNVALPGLGNLTGFWREPLTEVLAVVGKRSNVVNLLPNEHGAAIDLSRLAHVVQVEFVNSDGLRAAGHAAKAVKGRFARHLIDFGLGNATEFSMVGWHVKETSSGFKLVARE
jgi:hypothetical protein